MKRLKIISLIFLLGISHAVQAQILFGTTAGGGTAGTGTINKFIPATNYLKVVKSFESLASRFTDLIQASDGKLYGMATAGGTADSGFIFWFDPVSYGYKKLKNFSSANGFFPAGSLLQAGDGKLYGMTYYGGSNNAGVIFSFDPANSVYTKLWNFDPVSGANPEGSLIQGTNGKFYGMTSKGGSSDAGVIFSFDALTLTFKKLQDFNIINGANPSGNLVQAGNGKLYGMTPNGGSNTDDENDGFGVIFSFDPLTYRFTKLKDLDFVSGSNPKGSLMQAANGKLYGITDGGGVNEDDDGEDGCGVIFSFTISTSSYKKLIEFDHAKGCNPVKQLTQSGDGKLYGTTKHGGIGDVGVIFSFDPVTLVYAKLKDFDDKGCAYPGGLSKANDGKLYGMTNAGARHNLDGIFSFAPSSLSYKKLKDFNNPNGAYPYSALVQPANGKLYGMTTEGGNNFKGTLFSYDASTSVHKKLKDFTGADGANPRGSLTQAGDGKLYGMTQYGGSDNYGVIFSFDPQASTYKKLKDFHFSDGGYPEGSLIAAGDGKLYGVAGGGSRFSGLIFSYDPGTLIYKVLLEFDGVNGGNPVILVQAGNGKLYGTTAEGGTHNAGVIFSFDPVTSLYIKRIDFKGSDGSSPSGNLVEGNNGKLFGLTYVGGSKNAGVIFSFDLSKSTCTKLKDFDSAFGKYPKSLMLAEDGKLYGTTYGGGKNDFGVIFSFEPASGRYLKLKDFTGANGANANAAFISVKGCIAGTTFYQDADGDGYGDAANPFVGCPQPAGYVANKTDCNDANAAVHPGAAEGCNGVDDDCDGKTDSKILEAEEAGLSGGAVASYQPGFTGTGYIDFDKMPGAYIEWQVKAPAAGKFLLQFRYANGVNTDRRSQLSVNGVVIGTSVAFSPTGGWQIWSVSSVAASLVKGENKVRLTPIGNDGPNVDHLKVQAAGCHQGTLEAEEAVLSGAVSAAVHPGFTGSGYADYKQPAGDFIQWTVDAAATGIYSIKFRYSNGATADRPLQLDINGAVVKTVAFSPTGSWANWLVSSATVNLALGSNLVKLTTIGLDGPNVDHLTIELVTGTLEAERAVLAGAIVSTSQSDYTGYGFARYVNPSGGYIEWTLDLSSASSCLMEFRYANDASTNKHLTLEVNGVVVSASLPFPPTGGPDVWSFSSTNTTLSDGINTIRLSTTGTPGPNIDHLKLSTPGTPVIAGKGMPLIKNTLGALPVVLKASVAPNPAKGGRTKLIISSSSNLPITVKVLDMQGRGYKSFKLLLKGSGTIDVPVNELPPGVYNIILQQGNVSTRARLITGGTQD